MEAVLHYVRQHYDEAQAILAHLYAVYPHRLDQLDTYSNILYVKEDAATLSFLAHHLSRQHKYHHITQCVIGNYYALKSQHTRSITHFQRALTLNPGLPVRVHADGSRVHRAAAAGRRHTLVPPRHRHQQRRLPCVVRPGPGVRAAG